tara:strand:+ start:253 stop:417 length:165 start_codon:yes stop_codon:yes gene_type:complete
MEINKNIELLNNLFIKFRVNSANKLYILGLAKVSKNIEELKENIKWEKETTNMK